MGRVRAKFQVWHRTSEPAIEEQHPCPGNRPKTAVRLIAGFVACFAGAIAVYIIAVAPLRPWPLLWARMYDDIGYYLQIGLNYADGLGFTFDGRNPTNGFQPLWQAVLAFMQMTLPFQDQPEQFVRVVLAFQGVLLTTALVIFSRALRFLDCEPLRWLGIVLFLIIPCLRFRDGMESALLVLLAAIAIYLHTKNAALERWSIWHCFGFGALLGGVLLARLDSIFWVIGILAIIALLPSGCEKSRVGIRLCRTFWIGLTCAATLVPYLASNYFTYGHLAPISGALKSSFPVPGFYAPSWTLWFETSALVSLAVVLSIACLMFELGPWRRIEIGPLRQPACAIAIGVLLHSGYEALFMKWGVYPWHFALELFAVCLLLPYLCSRIASFVPPELRSRATGAIGVVVAVLACSASAAVFYREWLKIGQSWAPTAYRAAQWVKANLPDDVVIAMSDSGTMGFFSGRPVVNLDGLANNFDYQNAIRDGRFREFLRESGVNYYAQHSSLGDPELTSGEYSEYPVWSYSHLYEKKAEEFRLKPSQEVYRSAYDVGSGPNVLVIWRLEPENLGGGGPSLPTRSEP